MTNKSSQSLACQSIGEFIVSFKNRGNYKIIYKFIFFAHIHVCNEKSYPP